MESLEDLIGVYKGNSGKVVPVAVVEEYERRDRAYKSVSGGTDCDDCISDCPTDCGPEPTNCWVQPE